MSKIEKVYLSDQDEKRLAMIAQETGRSEGDLIDSAVSEAINDYWNRRPTFPVRKENNDHT